MPTKIMIVDDEEDITLVFKMGLEESGFEVDIFNDPVNALKFQTKILRSAIA